MLHWVMQGYFEALSAKFWCHLSVNDNTGHVRYAKNVGARYLGGIIRLAKFGSHIMVTLFKA